MNLLRRAFLRSAALTAGATVFMPEGFAGVFAPTFAGPSQVTFDSRSLMIAGRRELMISGEMHYSRSTREMWPQLLDRSKHMGLNCIATYVFWNKHEPQRGNFDFVGDNDLAHFLALCAERGLHVFLRLGPYCCAEWNFGGFPSWLRDEPGITFRTMSQPYLSRVEIYFKRLAEVVRPFLASNGGPVILVQVENEYANIATRYGEAGQEYLLWMVDLSQRVGLSSVPTTTCAGGAPGAIETANGNVITPEHVREMLAKHPNTPALWSELYPAWYQTWGGVRPKPRAPQEIASAILAFVGAGGSGWNYYMWHGGTNFGRNSMYLQTTSYDFDAPLDEFGRETQLGLYLARLHMVLRTHQDLILEGKREHTEAPSGLVSVRWMIGAGSLVLLANPTSRSITDAGQTLLPGSARMLRDEVVIFDTESVVFQRKEPDSPWEKLVEQLNWASYHESMPQDRADTGTTSAEPVEQLPLTRDETDYCWYSAAFVADSNAELKLDIPRGGDFFYVFVDGKPVAQSGPPFYENRGFIVAASAEHPRIVANHHDDEHLDGFRHQFSLGRLPAGVHRLDLLAVALGLIKGDWQIGYPMNLERKGIWAGVLLNGAPLRGWRMRPQLSGELLGMSDGSKSNWRSAPHVKAAAQSPSKESGRPKPLTWYRTEFSMDAAALGRDADYRIDASGMGKGALFLNNRSVGRYWLIDAESSSLPSQRYYHVPRAWLSQRNVLVLFEEQAKVPTPVAVERRIGNWKSSSIV